MKTQPHLSLPGGIVIMLLSATLQASSSGTGSHAASYGAFTPEQHRHMADTLERAWVRMNAVYFSPKTSLFYNSPVEKVAPASFFSNGRLDPDTGKAGYGTGMEDCAIYHGVLLSMLADRYEVTGDDALKEAAFTVYRGMAMLATVHGVPGFVARGICAEDGKSICITSSRDQYTHFVHGIWRYYRSPLCDTSVKTEIRTLMRAIAERMIANVTPENDYDFLRADGSRDPRGICRMWNVRAHEAARLPMIYAAAWDICGDTNYYRLYRSCLVPALEQSLAVSNLPQTEINRWMPTYTLLQMQTSLELLYDLETDAAMRAKICDAMQPVAVLAAARAVRVNGGEEKWSMCACGEAALAQLMARDFTFTPEQQQLLYTSIIASDVRTTGTARTSHLTAAYWRARRSGLLTPP